MYRYIKQGCGVAVKEIIQYLRIRETRCLQNALKWYETKSFPGTNIKNSEPPKTLPRLFLDPSYGPGYKEYLTKKLKGKFVTA